MKNTWILVQNIRLTFMSLILALFGLKYGLSFVKEKNNKIFVVFV
jgi:hypothetical protein